MRTNGRPQWTIMCPSCHDGMIYTNEFDGDLICNRCYKKYDLVEKKEGSK
jgi:uncharacterized protein YbaR (Trm112 family)